MSLSHNNSQQLTIIQPIFLIGFMGCGKTTMGKKIARKAKIPFIDLDQKIVEQEGMSISDYFALHGEAEFRKTETKVLRSMSQGQAIVVSTGGGAPCFNDNIDWMNENGMTVYLKLPPKMLLQRLSGKESQSRPLLQNKSDEEVLNFITTKLNERKEFYEKAKLIVDVHNMNPTSLLSLILTELQSK